MALHLVDGRDDLRPAVDALRAGRLVAFPTETVYGLGARADDPAAIDAVYRAKGRPEDNPLIVHVIEAQLSSVVAAWPAAARRLSRVFWPGALTIVATRNRAFPDRVSAGRPNVAVRCPDHPVARRLIESVGPLAAPSANRSGTPSPTTAQHVLDDLGDVIDVVVDGGPCRHGLESTVVDVTCDPPMVLRPGSIPVEDLRAVIGEIAVHPSVDDPHDGADARAPGMRHRHYSPRAELILLEGDAAKVMAELHTAVRADEEVQGLAIAREAGHPRITAYDDATAFGRALYATLRALDSRGVARIVVAAPSDEALGRTILNRLRKAATRRVVL